MFVIDFGIAHSEFECIQTASSHTRRIHIFILKRTITVFPKHGYAYPEGYVETVNQSLISLAQPHHKSKQPCVN